MLNFLVIYSVFTKFQATEKFNWGLYSCAVLPKQDLGKKIVVCRARSGIFIYCEW